MSRPNLAFVHYNCKLEMRHCCQGLCWRMESGCQGNHFLAFMRSDQRWKSVFFSFFFALIPSPFHFVTKPLLSPPDWLVKTEIVFRVDTCASINVTFTHLAVGLPELYKNAVVTMCHVHIYGTYIYVCVQHDIHASQVC